MFFSSVKRRVANNGNAEAEVADIFSKEDKNECPLFLGQPLHLFVIAVQFLFAHSRTPLLKRNVFSK